MDTKGVGKKDKNKKRVSSDEHDNSKSKRIHPSTPAGLEAGSVAEAERGFVELLSRIKPFLNQLVQVEVKSAFETHFHSLLESLREKKEKGEVLTESEIENYKLVFCNEIGPIIFTNNEIRGENGEPLRVAICAATTNTIICTGLLSSALVEFFVLDGEYGSGQQEEETHRSLSDFNKSILSPREGKRPLLVGNDQKLTLEDGIGVVKNLSITDNSSWMKSKKFRLGVKIKDEKILAEFQNIRVAVSQPFRVMDHRGEVNKKHHPPSREDEVWRLEGIGKDGAYHKNLSFQGIKTVGDFLEAYHEIGPTSLRKLLGIKVPKRTWMTMVDNAFECVTNEQSSKVNFLGNKVMGADDQAFNESYQLSEPKNLGFGFEASGPLYDEELAYVYAASFFSGEASTSYEAAATQTLTPNTIKDLGSSLHPNSSV